MQFTNEQIFETLATLVKAEEKGMLGYAIAKNRRLMTEEIKEYSDKRDELLREFGTNAGEGKYTLSSSDANKFFEALRPFSQLTVELPVMKVTPEVFYSGSLTSSQMFDLDWMIEE